MSDAFSLGLETTELGFTYSIVRSKRKTAAIHVSHKGVVVRIPYGVTDAWCEQFVLARVDWIHKALNKQALVLTRVPSIEFGEAVRILGRWRELDYQYQPSSAWQLSHDQLTYFAPNQPDNAKLVTLLQNWFKVLAQNEMPIKTQQLAKKMGLENRLKAIKFRRTKSKWGHCTSLGVIQYNPLIMGATPAVIEYLICHELCHLLQPNHSAKFWALVAKECEGYKEQMAWLKQHSLELSWC